MNPKTRARLYIVRSEDGPKERPARSGQLTRRSYETDDGLKFASTRRARIMGRRLQDAS